MWTDTSTSSLEEEAEGPAAAARRNKSPKRGRAESSTGVKGKRPKAETKDPQTPAPERKAAKVTKEVKESKQAGSKEGHKEGGKDSNKKKGKTEAEQVPTEGDLASPDPPEWAPAFVLVTFGDKYHSTQSSIRCPVPNFDRPASDTPNIPVDPELYLDVKRAQDPATRPLAQHDGRHKDIRKGCFMAVMTVLHQQIQSLLFHVARAVTRCTSQVHCIPTLGGV